MLSHQAHQVIATHRRDAVVVATMTSSMVWRTLSDRPDSDYLFSDAMGFASSLGLGIALALPDRTVLVLDGDGSLLMNLGSLVTIAHAAPVNLIHFVFDNKMYGLTGGQPTPRAGKIRFTDLALNAGYAAAYDFDAVGELETSLPSILNQQGPTFVSLQIAPYSRA